GQQPRPAIRPSAGERICKVLGKGRSPSSGTLFGLARHPQAQCVTCWARIHRLVIVYRTIRTRIGYWLSSTLCAARKPAPTRRCARYMAITWPLTISTTWTYQTSHAEARSTLG